jgi:hypothetical protein
MQDHRLDRRIIWLSLLPLSMIIFGEMFKIFFYAEFQKVQERDSYIDWWMLLQLVLAPLLGLLSDKFCRKKILLLTLCSLILSAAFLRLAIFLQGPSDISQGLFELSLVLYSLGAVTPIARAAYCDVHISNQKTPNIINTFLVQPLPWIFFYKFTFNTFGSFIGLILFGVAIAAIALFYFVDQRDRKQRRLSLRFKKIREEYGWGLCSRILIAVFISNSAWNLLQFYFEENESIGIANQYFSLAPGVAFLGGVIIARLLEIDLKKMIGLVFAFIGIFTLIQFIEGAATGNFNTVLRPIFISFTFFGGIGLPLIYAFFGRNADLHEQGVLYGLLDSFQKLTEWTGSFSLNHVEAIPDHPFTIAKFTMFVGFIPLLLTIQFLRTKWFHQETNA